MTRVFDVSAEPSAISFAAEVIRQGGLVAFPTETVYGLGAKALDADAVARIYAAKQRALSDPLIVHVAPPQTAARGRAQQRAHIDALVAQQLVGSLTPGQANLAQRLMDAFWPGPLTLVFPRGDRIPPNVTAGRDTVAIRMPNHPVALELIRQSGTPIAAPSANRFGHVSPTTAQHVMDDLDGRIDVVLDGGATIIGIESTVLDLTVDPPAILRPGGLAREQIEAEIGRTQNTEHRTQNTEHRAQSTEHRAQNTERRTQSTEHRAQSTEHRAQRTEHRAQNTEYAIRNTGDEGMASPGMLSKHYAPRAVLRVVRSTAELVAARFELMGRGQRVGLLITDSQLDECVDMAPVFALGRDLGGIARNLYAGLRALDSAGVDVILVSEVEAAGLGEAIADRLRRGAGQVA